MPDADMPKQLDEVPELVEYDRPWVRIWRTHQVKELTIAAANDFPNLRKWQVRLSNLREVSPLVWGDILDDKSFHRILQFLRCVTFDHLCMSDPISGAIITWHLDRSPYSDPPRSLKGDHWAEWYNAAPYRLPYARALAMIPECDKPKVGAQLQITESWLWIREYVRRSPSFLVDESLEEWRGFLCRYSTPVIEELLSSAKIKGLQSAFARYGFGELLYNLTNADSHDSDDTAISNPTTQHWVPLLTAHDVRYGKALAYKRDEVDSPFFTRRFEDG